ncbi:hypothetical protein ARMSODRAFT_730217 [Armillaria solidipes]|uniref:Uncharacterized protein n=1 Tax=Armillaria solidipes TaxID=1076256 RepID=A0A2H3B010_9AGAR|nr:hypothetical protein ARMSODRAFT_730217 [Armillaria solidipes]
MSDASKQALSLQSFRSAILESNLVRNLEDLYTAFGGSKELDLSFNGIAEESQAPILNPPTPGTSLIKMNLEGYCDPILQSIVRTQKYPFSVSNLQTLSISLQRRSTAVLLTGFLDLELPSLEYLNVVDQELFLDPARTTYPTLNIAQLSSIYISLKTYGSASDHDALGWWVESLKKAKDASIETITLSITLVDYRLPPSGVPDVWSDLARVLSESAMGSIRDVVIGFSDSYNQAEARQLYKTAVETTMASLIARGIVSVLEEEYCL